MIFKKREPAVWVYYTAAHKPLKKILKQCIVWTALISNISGLIHPCFNSTLNIFADIKKPAFSFCLSPEVRSKFVREKPKLTDFCDTTISIAQALSIQLRKCSVQPEKTMPVILSFLELAKPLIDNPGHIPDLARMTRDLAGRLELPYNKTGREAEKIIRSALQQFLNGSGCLHKKARTESGFTYEAFIPRPETAGYDYSKCRVEVIFSGFAVADTAYYHTPNGYNEYAVNAARQGKIVLIISGVAVGKSRIGFSRQYDGNIYYNSYNAAQEQVRIMESILFAINMMMEKECAAPGKGIAGPDGNITLAKAIPHSFATTSVVDAIINFSDTEKTSKEKGLFIPRRILLGDRMGSSTNVHLNNPNSGIYIPYIQRTSPYEAMPAALNTYGGMLGILMLAAFKILYYVTHIVRYAVEIAIIRPAEIAGTAFSGRRITISNPINLYLPSPFAFKATQYGSEELVRKRYAAWFVKEFIRAFLPSLRFQKTRVYDGRITRTEIEEIIKKPINDSQWKEILEICRSADKEHILLNQPRYRQTAIDSICSYMLRHNITDVEREYILRIYLQKKSIYSSSFIRIFLTLTHLVWGYFIRPLVPLFSIKPELSLESPENMGKEPHYANGFEREHIKEPQFLQSGPDIDPETGAAKRVSIFNTESLSNYTRLKTSRDFHRKFGVNIHDTESPVRIADVITGPPDRLLRWEHQMQETVERESIVCIKLLLDIYNKSQEPDNRFYLIKTPKGMKIMQGALRSKNNHGFADNNYTTPEIISENDILNQTGIPVLATVIDEEAMQKMLQNIKNEVANILVITRRHIGLGTRIGTVKPHFHDAGTFREHFRKVLSGNFEDWLVRDVILVSIMGQFEYDNTQQGTLALFTLNLRSVIYRLNEDYTIRTRSEGLDRQRDPDVSRCVDHAKTRFTVLMDGIDDMGQAITTGHNPWGDGLGGITAETLRSKIIQLDISKGLQSIMDAA